MASEIWLGREWDARKGRAGRPVTYKHNRHLSLFGPTTSGKGIGIEMPNLLTLTDLSIISLDSKGQNAAVTGRWRKTVSDVVYINPLRLFDIPSSGFNPLARLDPTSPRFFVHSSAIAEAMQHIPDTGDPFFPMAARNLLLVLIMWEVTRALAASREPLLTNVREMLTGDLQSTAKAIVASGDFKLASLATQFLDKNKTTDGIIATAASHTQWLLDDDMQADLAVDGIDFARLKQRPTTVYVMLPADALETFSAWTRLVVACAFNALYREGGRGFRTLFLLSEFAQLGNLSMVSAALAQGAGYGIQIFPVLQDINQLRRIYGRDASHTFLGMSGATLTFAPNDLETAAWISSRCGEDDIAVPTVSNDAQGPPRESWRSERKRRFTTDDLFDIPPSHGLVLFAGQSRPQAIYAPPYWTMPELAGRFDPDPYHSGTPSKPRRRRTLLALAVAAAVIAVAVVSMTGRTGIRALVMHAAAASENALQNLRSR